MNLSTYFRPAPPAIPLQNAEIVEDNSETFPDILSPTTTESVELSIVTWPNRYISAPGTAGTLTLAEVAEYLTEQGVLICSKDKAEIFGLFTATDNRRTDDAILSISALALDCDNMGSWDVLQRTLDRLDVGYVLYQSPSHTSTKQNWRCVLVLDRPFKVAGPEDRVTWTALYSWVSKVLGSVARLQGTGFDGSTTNVSRIWYAGPRPTGASPRHEVVWRDGRALSLEKLLVAVPRALVSTGRVSPGEFQLSLAGLAFDRAGLLGKRLGEGKFAVRCPRDSEHTEPIGNGSPDSSTVIFSVDRFGGFKCQHSHSRTNPALPTLATPFTLKHALDVLESQHPGLTGWARGAMEKANTPDSPLSKAIADAKDANRAAKKEQQLRKDQQRAAETDLASVETAARLQPQIDKAERFAKLAAEADEKVHTLIELLKDSVVVFEHNDDLAIATRIIADWVTEYCVFDQGSFYTYTPELGIWRARTRQELEHRVTEYQDALVYNEKGVLGPVGWNSSKISGVARVMGAAASRPGFFDEKQPAVCFKNGVLRLLETPEGLKPEFVAHSPDFRHRYSIGVDYGGPVPAPAWDKFLDEVLEPDDQGLLHEFLGACLVEDATRYQRAVMLVGNGRNGKTSLLETVRHMFPPEGQAALAPALWSRRFQATRLIAKAINVCDEVPNARIEESDTFKKIVTGGATETEFKGQDGFNFKPTAGHLFAANELPATNDTSEGFFRRWVIINMERQIPEDKTDVHIGEKLKADVPGIVSRCIDAYLVLQARGRYEVPETSKEARAAWEEDSNHVLRFLRGHCEKGDKDTWRSVADIHRKYKQVATEEGVPINDQVSTRALGRALKQHGFKDDNKGPAGGRGWLVKYKPLAGIGNTSPFPRN